MENSLKVYRAREDLTQGELAERVDVSRQTVNSIETGRYDPSLELAFKLAHEFGCNVEDIFEFDPDGDATED
ncbi:MAG: putative transcriptional regulator [Methanobacteriota archaeon]|uniref:Helix-turn-helix transcriptional regulator n=1 Tax=Halorutilus salinus TaxID=2487751 RepID=A0A9Q4GFL8_9EURY|nr:helix-turn-helix transcriptional regulator [Halorutilus salinus]